MAAMAGRIVVINKKGQDGASFSLTDRSCVFGRQGDCDIRIVKPNVSLQHARLRQDENHQVWLQNLSETNVTLLNSAAFSGDVLVKHGDVFTICDRSFRFELDGAPKMATPAKPITESATAPARSTPPPQQQQQQQQQQAMMSAQKATTGSPRPRSILAREPGSGRRKSVVMGPPLSPELFDKELPPATPLKRGAKAPSVTTPAAAPAPLASSGSRPRSRLSLSSSSPHAMPEASGPLLSQAAPDLISFELSPPKNNNSAATPFATPAATPAPPAAPALAAASVYASPAPAPKSKPATPAPAGKPNTPAPASKPNTPAPASKPATPAPESGKKKAPLLPTPTAPTAAAVASIQARTPITSRLSQVVSAAALTPQAAAPATPSASEVARSVAAAISSARSSSAKAARSAPATPSAAPAPSTEAPVTAEITIVSAPAAAAATPAPRTPKASSTTPSLADELREVEAPLIAFTPTRQTINTTACDCDDDVNMDVDEESGEEKQEEEEKPTVTQQCASPGLGKSVMERMQDRRRLATPLRSAIAAPHELKATKKKLELSLQAQIAAGIALKKRVFPVLPGPVAASIQAGSSLRVTKKKLQTPLRASIQKGAALRSTRPPTMPTPLRTAIRGGITLKAKLAGPVLPSPVRRGIAAGAPLRSKLPAPALPAPVLGDIRAGAAVLKPRPALPMLPAALSEEIKAGTKLRARVYPSLPADVAAAIREGHTLRSTKRTLPADLQAAIRAPPALKSTRKVLPKVGTPLRRAIERGTVLRVTKPVLPTSLQADIKQGRMLAPVGLSSRPRVRPSLGAAIRAGVKLKGKPKIRKSLGNQIVNGIALKATKKTLPAALLASLKASVGLRPTNNLTIAEEHQEEMMNATRRKASLIRKLRSRYNFLDAMGLARQAKPMRLTAMQRLKMRTVYSSTRFQQTKRPAETDEMIAVRVKRARVREEAALAANDALTSLRSILRVTPAPIVHVDYEGIAELFSQPEPVEEILAVASDSSAAVEAVVEQPVVKASRSSRRKSIGKTSEEESDVEGAPKKKFAPRVPETPRIEVSTLSLAELKARLAALGQRCDGRKSDLVKRLTTALEPCPPANDEVARVELKKRKLSVITERIEDSDVEAGPATTPALTPDEVAGFSVARLREELGLRGLSTAGLKMDLRTRLLAALARETLSAPVPVPAAAVAPAAAAVAVVAPVEAVEKSEAAVAANDAVAEVDPAPRVIKKARRGRGRTAESEVAMVAKDEGESDAVVVASEGVSVDPTPSITAPAVVAPAPAAATAATEAPARGRGRGRRATAPVEESAPVVPVEAPVEEEKSAIAEVPASTGAKATKGRGKRAAVEEVAEVVAVPAPAPVVTVSPPEPSVAEPRSKRSRAAAAPAPSTTTPAAAAAAAAAAPASVPTAAALAAAADVVEGRTRRTRRA